MPTMKDVAKAAGVSIATVSATLSGASYVSPELQARVNAAIAALGYERNSMASGLKRGRSSLIGLIVSDVTNPFFTELVDHVQKHAQQRRLFRPARHQRPLGDARARTASADAIASGRQAPSCVLQATRAITRRRD